MERPVPETVELSLSDYSEISSLTDFLKLAAPGVKVIRSPGQPGSGEQGALDVLMILADSSVLVTVVKLLPDFLRSRKTSVSVTVRTKGKQLTVTADNATEVMPIVDRFLND